MGNQFYFCIAFLCCIPLFSAELKLDGVLGQSQPELSAAAIGSVASDSAGSIWFTNGGSVYRILRGSEKAQKIPRIGRVRLLGDGRDIFTIRGNRISRIRLDAAGKVSENFAADLKRPFQDVAVAPAGSDSGFAVRVKFAALDARQKKVHAWDRNGNALGVLLDLNGIGGNSRLNSIGFLPGKGDLLVGSGYPDCSIYRFKADGTQFINTVWPRRNYWAARISFADNFAWGINARALRLDEILSGREPVLFGDGADRYALGAASDGAGLFYLATSQGLKVYSHRNPNVCIRRFGGTGSIFALALNDGKIVVSAGNQLLGLMLDDLPDSPFFNTGNEPWRVGGNWSSQGIAAVPEKNAFLLLDGTRKTLWSFHPERIPLKQRMRDLNYSFVAPSDIACSGEKLLIADNGRLNVETDVREPLRKVDCFSPIEIVASGNGFLVFLRNGKTVWRKEFSVHDVAVIGNHIVAAGKKLFLFEKNGKQVFESPYELTALAAGRGWVIGAEKNRILRFKYKK